MNQTTDQRAEKLPDKLDENLCDIRLTVKEAAKYVNESPGVLRNWMRELRAHIPLVQGENGYNYFDQRALERIMLIRQLSRDQGYSLKQIEYYFATGGKKVKPEQTKDELDKVHKGLADILERLEQQEEFHKLQEQFNQVLVMKLDEQQNYIKESINKRDKLLLESLKASQEARKPEPKKVKFFKWLF